MSYKKPRLGPTLLRAAADPAFFDQVHVLFGGTGAVGGATALQLISLFETARRMRRDAPNRHPRVVITGKGPRDIAQFDHVLREVHQREHDCAPEELGGDLVRTAGGVEVALRPLAVNSTIAAIQGFGLLDEDGKRAAIQELLGGASWDDDGPTEMKLRVVSDAIRARVAHPFTAFLKSYVDKRGLPFGQTRFRSVVQAIPLVSLAAYAPADLDSLAEYIGAGGDSEAVDSLKSAYLEGIRDDFAHINQNLAHEVLAAHTTGVGGMYEDDGVNPPVPRLDFAHRARDSHLAQKQVLADRLTELYAERGIKMLITAAAIGIDAILVNRPVGVQVGIWWELKAAHDAGHDVVPVEDLEERSIHVYRPTDLDLLDADPEPQRLTDGAPLRFGHVIRSGENGFFTVPNADALYRVMRVTSTGELGLTLARVAALGDDKQCPTFVECRSYYTETDNSRQVMDLLEHPDLAADSVAGLSPKALQDLGSSKHQGELHQMGLLILMQRVRTLDGATPPAEGESVHDWFEGRSRPPHLAEVASMDVADTSAALTRLVTAQSADDLAALNPFFASGADHVEPTAKEILSAVAAIPSIGTPILYERDGRRRVLAGPYAAPVGHVITHHDTLAKHMRAEFELAGGDPDDTECFERVVEFHIANFGFADVRPLAVLVRGRSVSEALDGGVEVFHDVESFVAALDRVPPYTPFTSGGLLAFLVRIRCLASMAAELDVSIGSANEFRCHLYPDADGNVRFAPGVIEAFRMVSEGWEKNTGVELLDGAWGYGQGRPAARRALLGEAAAGTEA